MASSNSHKRKTEGSSTNSRKKARTDNAELISAAQNLEMSFGLDSKQRLDLATLRAIVRVIVKGHPYSEEILELLKSPIEASDSDLAPVAKLINKDREKLAEIYRSALEASIVQSNYDEDSALRERQNAIQDGQAAPAPSDAAKLPKFNVEQQERPMGIGRPFDTTAPSISIYHTVFSKFKKLVRDQTSDIPPAVAALAFKLIVDAAEVYATEEERLRTISPTISALLDYPVGGAPPEFGFQPDGLVFSRRPAGKRIPLLVMEAKNEIGAGGSDPSVQAAFSFRKLWSQDEVAWVRSRCCCPGFVLSMAGPQVTILGGVLTENFVVQPLTMPLGLAGFPNPDGLALHVAQVMMALRTCLNDLEDFYGNLKKSYDRGEGRDDSFWPAFRQYNNFVLKYTSNNLLHKRIGRVMFDAEVKPKDEPDAVPVKVKVKFTPRYGYEAHALLAEKNLAPKLRHFEKLEDDLAVVVMDVVDGPNLASVGKGQVPPQAIQEIKAALALLHEKDLVFGDLRPPNIMLCRKDGVGDKNDVMLVDFDWAGKHGEQRYPPSLNAQLEWVGGVEGGGVMRKEHDDAMLQLLL